MNRLVEIGNALYDSLEESANASPLAGEWPWWGVALAVALAGALCLAAFHAATNDEESPRKAKGDADHPERKGTRP